MERNVEQRSKIKEVINRIVKLEAIGSSLVTGGAVGTATYFIFGRHEGEAITFGVGFTVGYYAYDWGKAEIPVLYRKVRGRIREKSK